MSTLVLTSDLTLRPEDVNDPVRAIYVLQHGERLYLSKVGVEIRKHPLCEDQAVVFREGSAGGVFTLSRLINWLEALVGEPEPSPSFDLGLFEILADEINAADVLRRYDAGEFVEWWSKDGRRNVDFSKKSGAMVYVYDSYYTAEEVANLDALVAWLRSLAYAPKTAPTFDLGLFEISADEIDAADVLRRYDAGELVEWWSGDDNHTLFLGFVGGDEILEVSIYRGFCSDTMKPDPAPFVAWLREVAASPAPPKTPTRPSFDDVYSEVARVVARRASCDRAQVGAVLVDSLNRIVATGYNGAPRGLPSCDDVGHLLADGHCLRTIHAEANALMNAVADPRGSTLYVTHYPCVRCANLLVQAGVVRIVAGETYGDTTDAAALFEAANVKVEVTE